MNLDTFRARLDKVRDCRDGFTARCPAHQDRTPSLRVTDAGDRVLLHCFAGCAPFDILAAMGLSWRDAFRDEQHKPDAIRPTLRVQDKRYLAKTNAIEFTIVALDEHLPAERPEDAERVEQAHERLASLAQRYGMEEFAEIARVWQNGDYYPQAWRDLDTTKEIARMEGSREFSR